MLPEWSEGLDPRGSITLATLSYSLSMVRRLQPLETALPVLTHATDLRQIPSFYPLLDRVHAVLDPVNGLVGVADFYTSKDGGSARERVSPFAQRAA